MASPNLTREQAAQRAQTVSVNRYILDLDLTDSAGTPGTKSFDCTTTVHFAAAPGTATFIDLIAEDVTATLNGEPVDASGYTEEAGLALTGLRAENELRVTARFHYSNTGEGLHRFVDPTDDAVYLYSQFETADAKRMFACFDQPDLKAPYDVSVTAPSDWVVVTNGAEATRDTVDGGDRWTFVTTEPISTYLVALIAGPYAVWEDTFTDRHGSIDLRLFCRASLAEFLDPQRLFTETKQGFGFYHENFGVPYAFGKYDQLFVPEFNAGAMENAGAVTFLEDYVFRSKVTRYLYERRCETILHEMAHMWFGDLVTMRWWDDLWLNESFATFASVLSQVGATEYTSAWTTFANVEKSWAYRQDQLPSTHPVAADIEDLQAVEVNFDGITYAKGASVLKQLVAYVGLDPFLAGLRSYFADHAFGNATFDDLLGALERASGRDLSDWGAQWLKTTGINILRPDFQVDDAGLITAFTIVQDGAQPGAGELRTHRLAVGIYDDNADGRLVRVRRVELDVSGARTEVPELVGTHRGQLVLLNDDDLTYCSVRLDPVSLATVTSRIADIADSLPRTLGWSAAWEMTRQAEMTARDFVALVLAGIGSETEIGVVQRVLLQAQTAVEQYADPVWAAEHGRPRMSARLLELARAAAPGSDHQLAFVNALLSSAPSQAEVVVLRSMFDGAGAGNEAAAVADAGLTGLTVDTDLRWRLTIALARAGALDQAEIETEVLGDPTAAGARSAATATAARPLPHGKEQAWERAFGDDELSNITVRAVAAGIAGPGQSALLTPFTSRYFTSIDDVWSRRTSEVAQTVVIGLYPSWDISDAGVAAADAWLAGEHPSALRRLVLEGRDAVARAQRARDFDAAGR